MTELSPGELIELIRAAAEQLQRQMLPEPDDQQDGQGFQQRRKKAWKGWV
ncbi:hypothetical protein ACWDUL_02210 [Nocardia niigatensis]|nr:hypothetical protein [Nocardia niigatensis]